MTKRVARRSWTKDEMKALKTGARSKLTKEEIARQVGRSANAVRVKAFSEGIKLVTTSAAPARKPAKPAARKAA